MTDGRTDGRTPHDGRPRLHSIAWQNHTLFDVITIANYCIYIKTQYDTNLKQKYLKTNLYQHVMAVWDLQNDFRPVHTLSLQIACQLTYIMTYILPHCVWPSDVALRLMFFDSTRLA